MGNEFQVGDKVKTVRTWDTLVNKGSEGVIVGFGDTTGNPLIRFEGRTDLHNGFNSAVGGFESDKDDCWYISGDALELVWRPAFKMYDRVEPLSGYAALVGEYGVVKLIDYSDRSYLVEFIGRTDLHDWEGVSAYNDCWWYWDGEIEAAPVAVSYGDLDALFADVPAPFAIPSKNWFIAVLNTSGEPLPAHMPRLYTSLAQAQTVANRMADRHPDETFVVYEAVGAARVSTVKSAAYASI